MVMLVKYLLQAHKVAQKCRKMLGYVGDFMSFFAEAVFLFAVILEVFASELLVD